MSKKSLIWKIPCIVLGAVLGLVLLLLITVTVVLVTPKLRTAALQKGIEQVNKRTDLDVDLGRLYLSPFYQSPRFLYRAYKGEEDLPVHVEIDSLFIGHRGQDTLLYVHSLNLQGCLQGEPGTDLMARTIVLEQLLLDQTTAHSDTLIEAIGIDAIVGHLHVKSPGINLAEGKYPLHGLKLADTYIGIDLKDKEADTEEAPQDTTSSPMAFELPDGELSHVRFVLAPMGLDIRTDTLSVNALADVGNNRYDVPHLHIGDASLTFGTFTLPFEEVRGDAMVDLNTGLIQSGRLFARSDAFGAQANLAATTLNLETMRTDLTGDVDFRGNRATLKGFYDIDDELYDMLVNIRKVDISSFMEDPHRVELSGDLHAKGKGIDINSPATKINLDLRLDNAIYDDINVSGLALDASLLNKALAANLQFAHAGIQGFDIDKLKLNFATGDNTTLHLTTKGLSVDAESPMYVLQLLDQVTPLTNAVTDSTFVQAITSLQDLTKLDTLRRLIPNLRADIKLTKGSPLQSIIDQSGLDLNDLALSLTSDSRQSDLAINASIPDITAALNVIMTEGKTTAGVTANANINNGVMSLDSLWTDAAFKMDLERIGRTLSGTGQLALDNLRYKDMAFGNRTADIWISPSEQYKNAIKADVRLDDIPLEIVSGIVQLDDIDLSGMVRANATADGLPADLHLSAQVLPLGTSVWYKPYDVKLALSETPIVMKDNDVDLNDLHIIGADSTYLALNGGINLNTMLLDIVLSADNFVPTQLPPDGPIPVHGYLATDIHGRVTGPLDHILANVDVTVLPTTDITYPIDEKNLAQVEPHGTVNVQYNTADSELKLSGKIDVDKGTVRYSPKLYPMMPFKVDPESNVTFNGPLGQTMVNISASQQVKGDVQSEGEDSRRVVFNTGVRVKGQLDSLGLNAIGFFLEAPDDETITNELATLDEETRAGIAAALLATGMYMGESNVAAQKSGYALSSIIKSRINAALANSKMGNFIDVDISSGQKEHAAGSSNDTNISISKSLFKDRLRITVGSVISDNPEVNKANGLLSQISADYKLTQAGDVFLRAFSKRDYDNIFEGDLTKSGLGVGYTRQWKRDEITHKFIADADITYRSNNSIGPDLTLTHSTRNLLGHKETISVKGQGAYYWSLRNRQPGDAQRTNTYKFGIDAALTFPFLHWPGDNKPEGDTRYRIGYKNENIAGGYSVHKLSGGFSYFIRPKGFVTHVVTPFSLSLVKTKMDTSNLGDQVEEHPELLKMLAGDELVPSAGYGITYNDYRSRRPVNTMLDVEIKEAGNLTNAIFCAFGRKWGELDKSIGKMPFNQFVRWTVELWNKFNFTERICLATRLYAGANNPLGNSAYAPLSEAFYAGGPNSLRAAEPYAYGPGNFHSTKYSQSFFHAGDVKLEANAELRFPLVWKINGAVFVDAGNVWNWRNTSESLSSEEYELFLEAFGIKEDLKDGIINNPYFAQQIALGTGLGIRLDIEGLVVRLDLGVGIHAPYQTYKYNKDFTPDYTRPITTYYNIPSFLDAVRLNFGIGYPF